MRERKSSKHTSICRELPAVPQLLTSGVNVEEGNGRDRLGRPSQVLSAHAASGHDSINGGKNCPLPRGCPTPHSPWARGGGHGLPGGQAARERSWGALIQSPEQGLPCLLLSKHYLTNCGVCTFVYTISISLNFSSCFASQPMSSFSL